MTDRSTMKRLAMRNAMRGVGLIEVLVAMFIIAIGVLGASALQLQALKFNQTAGVRSQATFLAYEMADRMRANRSQAKMGSYNISLTASDPNCTAATVTLPQRDLCEWRKAVKARLPNGRGAVERSGNQFTITVDWDESRNKTATTSTPDIKEFVFITDL